MKRRCMVMFSAAMLAHPCLASQLLFSLATSEAGAHAPLVPPSGFQLVLQFDFPEPAIGTGCYWQDGSQGSCDFTSANSTGFDQFESRITDGVDQTLFTLLYLNEIGPGGGSGNVESVWGFGTPDLTGSDIDLIRLIVHDFHIAPYMSPIAGDGLQWETHFTWEFWGTPVPEPGTAAMLAVASTALIARRRRIGYSGRDVRRSLRPRTE